MSQLERQYISFNVWDSTSTARRPTHSDFLPVYGVLAVLPLTGHVLTKFEIYYNNNWKVTIEHDTDVNNEIMRAFILALQNARGGQVGTTPVEYTRDLIITGYTVTKA